jgi:hypothetical protein
MSSSKPLDFNETRAIVGQHIKSLRDDISTQKPPYCAGSGTAQIPQDQNALFYGHQEKPQT